MEPGTELSPEGLAAVQEIAGRVSRRTQGALVRNSFVRATSKGTPPPLATLSATKGRGAAVPLKLYLAMLWLAAKPPYDTKLSAAAWARVLDLPESETKGARRIRDAFDRLEEMRLVKSESVDGAPSKITICREDGSGESYSVPYKSIQKNKSVGNDGYFKLHPNLWLSGHIQRMSQASLVMLLIILEESRGKSDPQWWSTEIFQDRFSISKDVRARGTKELVARKLISVKSAPLANRPGAASLEDKRIRKTYRVTREVNPNLPETSFLHMLGELE